MAEHALLGLTLILLMGLTAQWLGWRFKLPAILILLLFGFIAGPISGFLQPNELFGDLLFPLVSGAVAIILFEGGLTLKFRDFKETGSVIIRLVSIGLVITFILAAYLAHTFLGFDVGLSIVFGALLSVTGPTVIGPMMRTIRPRGRLRSLAKWEGILNDPIGAVLAVLFFEAYVAGSFADSPWLVVKGTLMTLVVGCVLGGLSAWLLIVAIRGRLIPEFLQNPIILLVVVGSFALSDMLQHESGLLTVTILGIALANQPYFTIKHISEFKENLQIILISILFIILSARISPDTFSHLGWGSAAFLACLILFVRPLAVLGATLGSKTNWSERILLMLLAPRGIVAAAVASIFALRLTENGMPGGERLLAEMLLVIIGTVLIYGSLAGPIAQKLKLTNLNPQGILFVGAHSWARLIAQKLKENGIYVALVDINKDHTFHAGRMGLRSYNGNVFSEEFVESIDFSNIGHVVAITGNDEVNKFAETHLTHFIDRSVIYHLTPTEADGKSNPYGDKNKSMNPLFGEGVTYGWLERQFRNQAAVQCVKLEEEYDDEHFHEEYGEKALPLFCIHTNGEVEIFNEKNPPQPELGSHIVFIQVRTMKSGSEQPKPMEVKVEKTAEGEKKSSTPKPKNEAKQDATGEV